jgi:hypothetical protein
LHASHHVLVSAQQQRQGQLIVMLVANITRGRLRSFRSVVLSLSLRSDQCGNASCMPCPIHHVRIATTTSLAIEPQTELEDKVCNKNDDFEWRTMG